MLLLMTHAAALGTNAFFGIESGCFNGIQLSKGAQALGIDGMSTPAERGGAHSVPMQTDFDMTLNTVRVEALEDLAWSA